MGGFIGGWVILSNLILAIWERYRVFLPLSLELIKKSDAVDYAQYSIDDSLMSYDFLPLTGFSRLQTFGVEIPNVNKVFSPFSADFVSSVFTLAQMESLVSYYLQRGLGILWLRLRMGYLTWSRPCFMLLNFGSGKHAFTTIIMTFCSWCHSFVIDPRLKAHIALQLWWYSSCASSCCLVPCWGMSANSTASCLFSQWMW